MIGDARTIVHGATITADLCIIGAGAAGITLALELIGSGMRIVLLEAGGVAEDPEVQALYTGEVADPLLHSLPDKYRQRRFGGSTTIWGGRCVPLDPIDFEYRSWIPHSGWPISYANVAAHYPRANSLCEAGDFAYHADQAIPGGMRPLLRDFMPQDFTTTSLERFSCPTDFGKRYQARLASSSSVRVLLHANCTQLLTSPEGSRVERAVVQTFANTQFTVAAPRFVLATGALEATRLLLASRDVHAAGIGNGRGLVGRYYMCHIAGTIGTLRVDRPNDHLSHDYQRAEDGVYCRRRISLTAETQRREAVGNAVFRLHHPRIPDPRHRTGALSAIFLARRFISYEYGKRLATQKPPGLRILAQHLANAGVDVLGTSRFLSHWVRDRLLAERKFPTIVVRPRTNLFSLDFNAEQVPNWDSRIRLGHQTDRFGMPRLHIDWRYAETDVRTVATAFGLLQGEIARSGLGELSLDPDESDIEAVIRRDGAYGGHHIGTIRMGRNPADGVVDEHCRVFGVPNLYVASSAVFPTSGQANPTLTIVALTIRLARHLQAEAARIVKIHAHPAAPVPIPLHKRTAQPGLIAEAASPL